MLCASRMSRAGNMDRWNSPHSLPTPSFGRAYNGDLPLCMVTANRYLMGLNQKRSASSTKDRAEGPLARSKNERRSGLNSWNDGKLPPSPNSIRHNISHKSWLITRCSIHTSFTKQTPFYIMTSNQKGGFHEYTKRIFYFTVVKIFRTVCARPNTKIVISSYIEFFF